LSVIHTFRKEAIKPPPAAAMKTTDTVTYQRLSPKLRRLTDKILNLVLRL
jgi:hypothetical protein